MLKVNCRIKNRLNLKTFTNEQNCSFHAAQRRRIRRPSSLSNITESVKKPEVRVRSSTSTRSAFVPLKKVAQDRSDQQPAPSTNRFRVRSKHRGVIGAASAAIATTGTEAVLNQSKSKDKDGYKVCVKLWELLRQFVIQFSLDCLLLHKLVSISYKNW